MSLDRQQVIHNMQVRYIPYVQQRRHGYTNVNRTFFLVGILGFDFLSAMMSKILGQIELRYLVI